jgi:hypothetical protein
VPQKVRQVSQVMAPRRVSLLQVLGDAYNVLVRFGVSLLDDLLLVDLCDVWCCGIHHCYPEVPEQKSSRLPSEGERHVCGPTLQPVSVARLMNDDSGHSC